MQGIIIENKSNLYKVSVINKNNEELKQDNKELIFESKIRGKLKKKDISPVVGDFVEITVLPEEHGNKQAIIEEILPRKVFIKRPKISNITQMILVVSSQDPKPDLIMLDKQLAFAEYIGLKVVIVLNKTDLVKKDEFSKIENTYKNIGYKVIKTIAKDNKGIEILKREMKNNINVFSGNSGVGKSTLINSIFEREITKEGEISKKNKRGKNTTTKTRLYKIEEDTYIADTPGFSTFEISEIKSTNLMNYFIEFKQYLNNCEFIDCTHIKEKNCGIKKAIEGGKIQKDRYERFCKIYQELKQKEERKKW